MKTRENSTTFNSFSQITNYSRDTLPINSYRVYKLNKSFKSTRLHNGANHVSVYLDIVKKKKQICDVLNFNLYNCLYILVTKHEYQCCDHSLIPRATEFLNRKITNYFPMFRYMMLCIK